MQNEKITIMTSEIKKGDAVFMDAGKHYVADSDAYKHQGIWSFDIISGSYRYGFQKIDTEVEVQRKQLNGGVRTPTKKNHYEINKLQSNRNKKRNYKQQ